MKIVSLIEDTPGNEKVKTEHGLSLYIEWQDKKILFDTGQSNKFLHNANALGIDISDIDACVISHGHYDHGGGIAYFLRRNLKAKVYIQKQAFGQYLSADREDIRYIGIDPELENNPRIVLCEGQIEIFSGCELFGNVIERRFFSPANKTIMMGETDAEGEFHLYPDEFAHEQYLVLEEGTHRVLFGGCCHNGIVNVMRKARGLGYHPDLVISGFHFLHVDVKKSSALLDLIANELHKKPETMYYTCHCTGKETYEHMKTIMGEQIQYLACGESIEF